MALPAGQPSHGSRAGHALTVNPGLLMPANGTGPPLLASGVSP
jgi:hypothetical protein